MNSTTERPLWLYAMLRHRYWNRLKAHIQPDIRRIVDYYFEYDLDPVECWKEVEPLMLTPWWEDRALEELLEILMDCTIPGRFRGHT